MAHRDRNVKPECEQEDKPRLGPLKTFLCWIDDHPRTGWYLVVIASLNLLLNFLDLFH